MRDGSTTSSKSSAANWLTNYTLTQIPSTADCMKVNLIESNEQNYERYPPGMLLAFQTQQR